MHDKLKADEPETENFKAKRILFQPGTGLNRKKIPAE
jgi:hypothetical protein